MDEKSYFVDRRAIEGQKFIVPKVIAKITFVEHSQWMFAII